MGQIKIIERDWIYDNNRFWFKLDGPVTVRTIPTETKNSELITSDCWTFQKLGKDCWILQTSNSTMTNNKAENCLNEYSDTVKELFCRFTAQIIEYKKLVSFSPHTERLYYEKVELE